MSIHTDAAVRELSKEIERLTAMRDSLLTSPVANKTSKASTNHKTNQSSSAPGVHRPLSAETKKRIADAQKKRWANLKKKSGSATSAKAASKK